MPYQPGILVDPEDVGGFAEAFEQVLTDTVVATEQHTVDCSGQDDSLGQGQPAQRWQSTAPWWQKGCIGNERS